MGDLRRCLVTSAILVLACALGCTNKNRALQPNTHNHSRATLMVPVAPLAARQRDVVDRQSPTTAPVFDADGIFFGIAISGGGSRSANFSAACMFDLQELGLLQKADYVSSVSGGSLTAAYYCLATDKEWNPTNVQKRLTHSFADDVLWNTILPWNWIFLTFSDWDRSDLLADSFRKHLFTRDGKELTFANLRDDRPRLLINATDLQSGKPFVFSDESFDRINSDLLTYPISHAVAASAAVPVLLHHVTLRDHSTSFKQYRHLIDGGVTDNLGIRTLTDIYDAQIRAAEQNDASNPYPRGAVFIVIDARTNFDAKLSNKSDIGLIETLATGAGLTSTVLINRASSATLSEIIVEHSPEDVTAGTLRKQKEQLERDGYLRLKDRGGRPVDVVHLALSRVNDVKDLPFASFSDRVNSIATYFNISQTEAYNLYQAAELLTTYKFDGPLREVAKRMAETHSTSAPVR
ncbi:MAG: patatin-like phospholipase family protein [Tepidisphaeraceae bacterium]